MPCSTTSSGRARLIEELPDQTVYWHRQANLEDVFLRLTGRQLREN